MITKAISKLVPYRKRLLVMAIVILVAALIMQFVPIVVFASGNSQDTQNTDPFEITYDQLVKSYKKAHKTDPPPNVTELYRIYVITYQELHDKNSMLSFAFLVASIGLGVNPIVDVGQFGAEMLSIRDSLQANNKVLLQYIGDAYAALKVTGLTLMLLYFFLSIMDKVTSEQLSVEIFIRKLILLAVGIITILYGYEIFSAIIDYSNFLIQDTAVFMDDMRAGTSLELLKKVKEVLECGNSSLVQALCAIGVILQYIIYFIAQLAMTVVVFVVGVSRLIEIIIRFIFAPIGLAPIVHDGMRSSGFRYIKKFAACCINGAVIVCIAYLASILPNFFTADNVGVVFAVCSKIAFPLATIALVFRCQNIADEIIGVH